MFMFLPEYRAVRRSVPFWRERGVKSAQGNNCINAPSTLPCPWEVRLHRGQSEKTVRMLPGPDHRDTLGCLCPSAGGSGQRLHTAGSSHVFLPKDETTHMHDTHMPLTCMPLTCMTHAHHLSWGYLTV